MAQNEIQRYSEVQNLYANLRNVVSVFYNTMDQMDRLSSFLTLAEATDYPSIPTETLTVMAQLRTEINNHKSSQATIDLLARIKEIIQI